MGAFIYQTTFDHSNTERSVFKLHCTWFVPGAVIDWRTVPFAALPLASKSLRSSLASITTKSPEGFIVPPSFVVELRCFRSNATWGKIKLQWGSEIRPYEMPPFEILTFFTFCFQTIKSLVLNDPKPIENCNNMAALVWTIIYRRFLCRCRISLL